MSVTHSDKLPFLVCIHYLKVKIVAALIKLIIETKILLQMFDDVSRKGLVI